MNTLSHKIQDITFEANIMVLTVNNQQIRIALAEVSPKLNQASESVRNNFRISTSGYGIHWPQIDEDLSLAGLLKKSGYKA